MTTTITPVNAEKRDAGGAPPPSGRPEDARLSFATSLGYGLQHILSMFGGVIAVPIIVGGAAGLSSSQIALLLSCSLLVSGLATLLQTVGVPGLGAQLPLVQGISFASVSTLLTIVGGRGEAGMRDAMGAVLAAAVIAMLVVPFFAQIVRFFPPVVTGSIITVIGLSLLPVAAGWITGQATRGGRPNPDFAAPSNLALAAFSLVVVLLLSRFEKVSRMAILLALVAGTVGRSGHRAGAPFRCRCLPLRTADTAGLRHPDLPPRFHPRDARRDARGDGGDDCRHPGRGRGDRHARRREARGQRSAG